MQCPLYLKVMKSTRISQGKLENPLKVPITIDESTRKREELGPSEGNIEEVTFPKDKSR